MTSPQQADDETAGAVPPEAPPRPPVFNIHGSILFLAGICILVHVVRMNFLSVEADNRLLIGTAFFPIRYLPGAIVPDLPTLFSWLTYSFIHGDWIHLTINLIWLLAFGSPLAFRLGWGRTLLFWVVTAGAAAATHLVIYYGDAVPVIGASGAVSGFMGAAARFGLRANRREPRRGFDGPLLSIRQTFQRRGVIPFLAIWVALNVAVGLDVLGMAEGRSIAWEAHIGGLLAGFFLIPLFDRKPVRPVTA